MRRTGAVSNSGALRIVQVQFKGGGPRLGRWQDLSQCAMGIAAGALWNCGAMRLAENARPELMGRAVGLGRDLSGGA